MKNMKQLNIGTVIDESLNNTIKQDLDTRIQTDSHKHILIQNYITMLTQYMIDGGMNIEPLPTLKLKDTSEGHDLEFFCKTAYYNPNTQCIVLFTKDRHPKDVVRSFSHEMVHHLQNLEGRLGTVETTNTNEDGSLQEIEKEAYLTGNMTFRNWEDSVKNKKD